MRVLMVTGALSGEGYGGAERFCEDLSRRLSEASVEVEILTSRPHGSRSKESITPQKVKVHSTLAKCENRIGRKFVFDYFSPQNAVLIREHASSFNPDVVHFHNVYGIGSNLIRESSRKVPTVVTVHDYWPFCFRGTMHRRGSACKIDCWKCRFPLASLTRRVKRLQLENSVLVAPSNYMSSALRDAGFVSVRTIHNAVDSHGQDNLPARVDRLLYVGRVIRDKGVELVCEAAEALRVRLDIVGTGSLISRLASVYKDSQWVCLKGYFVDPSSLYESGGVLVLPSLIPENLPTAPLEAMARGLPVVGSKIGGIPEIVCDGYNGKLFEPGDLEGLLNGLRFSLSEDNYSRLSRNCLTTVSSKFNWAETVRSYLDLYDELAG